MLLYVYDVEGYLTLLKAWGGKLNVRLETQSKAQGRFVVVEA